MTHDDACAEIQRVLHELKPTIAQHGGEIEFVKYEESIVYVRLNGACSTCPISLYTLKFGIEESLRQRLPSVKEVVALEE